jgi:NADPH:quinone reductase-like Zn-dependent oxidoreductase
MRAFAAPGFLQPATIQDVPDPVPGEGEVLIRLHAAGLNQTDLASAAGMLKDYMEHRWPLIFGIDGSGVVEAVGPGVTGFEIGDEVFGYEQRPLVGRGTLAEWAALPASGLLPKPASLEHHEAAVIPHSSLTAAAAVESAAVKDGDVVAVLGATGGVGSYATQLLAQAGVHVIAVTLGDYADYARSLGAEESIDYTAADVIAAIKERHPAGIDAVVDLAGIPDLFAGASDLVRPGGHVVSIVLPPATEALSARGVEGVLASRYAGQHRFAEITEKIVKGEIKLPAIQTFPFDEVAAAVELQATRHVRGKIAVLMN